MMELFCTLTSGDHTNLNMVKLPGDKYIMSTCKTGEILRTSELCQCQFPGFARFYHWKKLGDECVGSPYL